MGKNIIIPVKKFSFWLLGALVLGAPIFLNSTITIQSLESMTTDGKPVFNQIRYFPGWKKDVWMMNQSHDGLDASGKKWERLAIVVDKTKPTASAKFLQLPPGQLEWSDDLLEKGINYRVSCFMCHSNGPRAIRPNYEGLKLDFFSKVTVQLWNARIKTYGRIVESEEHKILDENLETPFRHRAKIDNEVLNVKSCTKCHSDKGFFHRGDLTRQNAMAIQFMLENKLMPPAGFSISEEDKRALQGFVLGL